MPALIARVIRIALTIIVLFAAISLLGLQFLSPSLNQAILELPRLLIAAALLLAGVVVAALALKRADRLTYQMNFPVPLGQIAQFGILAIFGIIAAAELGISTLILLVLIGVLLSAVAGTFTVAFGLGSRDVARALSAGRYLRHDYRVCQEIAFGDVRAASAGSTARAPCWMREKAGPSGCRTIFSSARSSRSTRTIKSASPDLQALRA